MKRNNIVLMILISISILLAIFSSQCSGGGGSSSASSTPAPTDNPGWGDADFQNFIDSAQLDPDVKAFREGLSYLSKGNYANARDRFQEAWNLSQGWKIAKYNLAYCYDKLGDTDTARTMYLETFGYDPFDSGDYSQVNDKPTHYETMASLFEIHAAYTRITQYGKTSGINRPFHYFYDDSPNLNSSEQAYDFAVSGDIGDLKKEYVGATDQAGYGKWDFWLTPAKTPAPGATTQYLLSYKVKDLPHLLGNSTLSIGSNPIPILTNRWILAFAFPESTVISEMFDMKPYKFERRNGYVIFFYDYIGVKQGTSIHIRFTLREDNPAEISADELEY